MKHLGLLLVIAVFSLPAAWAVADVTEARENVKMSDEALFLELGLAISGITGGRISPQATGNCEGTAVCKQSSGCTYKCFGAAGGDYTFTDCNGEVGRAICKFEGGSTDCSVRCLPNPF